ncbi:MAG TPA: M23 family metallopeptidase [Virgibacillus sp.]|nr:M23 family metallopeptidase [Virgibacillus sp.]
MKEENRGTPKNKWSRMFRKKWFFPAMYLIIATLLLTVVVWYQSVDNAKTDTVEDSNVTDNYDPSPYEEDAEAVLEQQEDIQMPVADQEQAEIVTKFYDYNAEQEDQEDGLVLYNNRYYQSEGIDIASADGEAFDVTASLSGTVTEVKEDPLQGHIVVLSHANDVTTYYASLGEVNVDVDSKVTQGDVIGTAGKSLFGKDNGTHLHFQLRKDGNGLDPETYFGQPLSKLDELDSEAEEEEEKEEKEEPAEESESEEDEEESGDTEDEMEPMPDEDKDESKEESEMNPETDVEE